MNPCQRFLRSGSSEDWAKATAEQMIFYGAYGESGFEVKCYEHR